MSDYWSNFNSWDNNVEILPEAEHRFRAEHTFVTEGNSKYITHGKSVYSTHGASWTYQDGDVTWYQIGNLGYKQIGVSNTVIEGWNFFTVLGMNINDTVGIGMDNYAGLRVGIHGGLALDVNAAAAVRLSRGPYYEIDETERWTTAAQKKELLDEELKVAKKTVELIEGEIQTIASKINRIGMEHEIRVGKIMHVATGQATFCGISTTCGSTVGQTMLNGSYVTVKAITNVTILSEGGAWINGAIIKIG